MRTAEVRVRVKGSGPSATVPAAPTNNAGMEAPAPAHQAASTARRMGGWRPVRMGPNAIVQADQARLTERSRDLARNNPQARRALSLYGAHIVGTGMKPRWLTKNAALRERLHELWDTWAPFADADGVLDIYGMQALAVNEMAEGGEDFGRFRPRRVSDGLPVPLQVQLIPVEQVPLFYSLPNGVNSVVQGIERNPLGQRVAYWMHRQHPGDVAPMTAAPTNPLDLVRVPAADVLHMYNVTRIGQLRGLPWLAAAMTTLQQVGQWQDASITRKQILAMLVGFVRKSAAGATADDLTQAWGEIREKLGDLPAVALEPGTMQYLDIGEEVQFTNWQETAGQDEVFMRTSYQSVSAAADLVYEELTGDYKNANDRTFRASFNTFKRRARQWQYHLLAHQFVRRIVNRWIAVAVGSGALTVPKSVSDAELYRVTYVPERWEYLNPKQDVEAVLAEIDGHLTARSMEIAARGDDAEVVDQTIADDLARETRLEISDRTAKPPKKPAAPPPTDPEQDL